MRNAETALDARHDIANEIAARRDALIAMTQRLVAAASPNPPGDVTQAADVAATLSGGDRRRARRAVRDGTRHRQPGGDDRQRTSRPASRLQRPSRHVPARRGPRLDRTAARGNFARWQALRTRCVGHEGRHRRLASCRTGARAPSQRLERRDRRHARGRRGEHGLARLALAAGERVATPRATR